MKAIRWLAALPFRGCAWMLLGIGFAGIYGARPFNKIANLIEGK